MQIRTAEPSDLAGCVALEKALAESRPATRIEGFLLSGDTLSAYETYFKSGSFLVAHDEKGKLSGFVFALSPTSDRMKALRISAQQFRMKDPNVLLDPHTGWIGKVAVDQKLMGKGIGSGLYTKLFEQDPSINYLTSTVLEPLRNTPSEALQKKFGFQVAGEIALGAVRCLIHYRPGTDT